jgi:hypothetical protein
MIAPWLRVGKEEGHPRSQSKKPAMPTRQSCPAISWFAGCAGAPFDIFWMRVGFGPDPNDENTGARALRFIQARMNRIGLGNWYIGECSRLGIDWPIPGASTDASVCTDAN